MIKKKQIIAGGAYFKDYETDEEYKFQNMFEELRNIDGMKIISVDVREAVDSELKTIEGIYPLEDFMRKYEAISEFDISSYGVNGKYNDIPVEVILAQLGKNITLVTRDQLLELTDILKKNDYRK